MNGKMKLGRKFAVIYFRKFPSIEELAAFLRVEEDVV